MIPRHERKDIILLPYPFLLRIYIDRAPLSDYVTMGDERITSRVFFSRKEAALEARMRANGRDSLSILVKERVIALRLHMTRATRSRAIQPRKKRRLLGYCIAWSISDRACFAHFNVWTCWPAILDLKVFMPITKINAKWNLNIEMRGREMQF